MARASCRRQEHSPTEIVATIIYSARALEHLEAAIRFLVQRDPAAAIRAAFAIRSAVGILEDHPLIGRARDEDLRKLVISYGKTGYVALYRFLPHLEEIRILAVEHQRELDYAP